MNVTYGLRRIAALALMAAGLACAQTYPDPSKPIRVVVPFAVGTSTDTLARALARGMFDVAGVNVVTDAKPGGESIIGAQAAKTAAPDGYTFFLTSLSTQVLNPHMLASLPYDPLADFIPLTGVALTPLMVNMRPSTSFKTLQEFIASARAQPGKYTVGIASTFNRLAAETLQRSAGVEMLVVPHKSANDAMISLAAGQLDMVLVDPSTAAPFYQKNVRPIATTGAARVAAHPNVPTVKEGALPGFELVGWYAAYFPAKTPPAIVTAMQDILRKALKTKHVTDVYTTFGLEPLDLAGAELEKFQRREYERWGQAVRAANLSPAPR